MMTRLLVVIVACSIVTLIGGCANGTTEGAATPVRHSTQTGPLRVAVIGMTHGHVEGLLWNDRERSDIEIVGIFEPRRDVFDRLAAKYGLAHSLYFDDLDQMLQKTRPEAASVMGPISEHRAAAEACAPRGVHLLFEKPLAFSADDARRIEALSTAYGVLALTNFETSWYGSVRHAERQIRSGDMGPVRHMIFRHGHKGPTEIGCSPEFVAWLTDPARNGGGASVDFGCYGAVISTWLMNGARPTTVTARASMLKSGATVDDDAVIVLTYPGATAVIMASWAWTHDNKEMDLHAQRGSLHAGRWDDLTVRPPDGDPRPIKPDPKPEHLRDEWTYLRSVCRGECPVDPLSSTGYNVIVAEILDVARRASKP